LTRILWTRLKLSFESFPDGSFFREICLFSFNSCRSLMRQSRSYESLPSLMKLSDPLFGFPAKGNPSQGTIVTRSCCPGRAWPPPWFSVFHLLKITPRPFCFPLTRGRTASFSFVTLSFPQLVEEVPRLLSLDRMTLRH